MADKQIELGPLLFEGKTKQVYAAPNKELIVIHYKEDNGIYNNKLSASFFRLLESSGIATHFVTRINDREQLCRKVEIISSPTGPDPENRVGDQDIQSPGSPVSFGVQVPGEQGIVVEE